MDGIDCLCVYSMTIKDGWMVRLWLYEDEDGYGTGFLFLASYLSIYLSLYPGAVLDRDQEDNICNI